MSVFMAFRRTSHTLLERPIRSVEAISDVLASSATDSSSLVVKARLRSMSPVASTTGPYVRLEVKKARWEKRYLDIDAEAGVVTQAKTDKVRPSVSHHLRIFICLQTVQKSVLCTISTFDLFIVQDAHLAQLRPPKPFALAFKSTDRLELFEDLTDAVHYLAVKTEAERDQLLAQFGAARVSKQYTEFCIHS